MSELQKCSECGKEFKNLAVHMRKHTGTTTKDKIVVEDPKPKKENSGSLEEKMDAMIFGLNSVSGALVKLVELQTSPKQGSASSESVVEKKANFVPAIEDETYPTKFIPPKFRKIVDEVLSPDFGINVQDFEDRTDFLFEIIVPDKYSSISKDDRTKGIKDVRSRMIARALGENGVREWTKLVRQNLAKFYNQEGVASPFINSV